MALFSRQWQLERTFFERFISWFNQFAQTVKNSEGYA